jgi:hypothetical protein
MSVPAFEYVPILPATSAVQVAMLSGLSTRHGSTFSDRGRLYGTLSGLTLTLYSSPAKSTPVLTGTASAAGSYFDLSPASGSGMTGRAILTASGTETNLVVVPTFAVDEDVMLSATAAAKLPGYDSTYGLAHLHAQAMRQIVASSLPAAMPWLFGGSGAGAFVPHLTGIRLPDLSRLANIDQLRRAQAELTKGLSARESEHVAEFAAIMEQCLQRFDDLMKAAAAANPQEQTAAQAGQAQTAGISVGSWSRR